MQKQLIFCNADNCNHKDHHAKGFKTYADLLKHIDHYHAFGAVQFNHDRECERKLKWGCSKCDYKSGEMIEAKKHYLDKHVERVALLARQTQEEIVRYEVDINRMMGNKRRREEDLNNDMEKLAKARVTYTILEESEKVDGGLVPKEIAAKIMQLGDADPWGILSLAGTPITASTSHGDASAAFQQLCEITSDYPEAQDVLHNVCEFCNKHYALPPPAGTAEPPPTNTPAVSAAMEVEARVPAGQPIPDGAGDGLET